MAISERFPALSPFDVRRERGSDVFLLIRRLDNYQRKQKKGKKRVLRKPAGDNWF